MIENQVKLIRVPKIIRLPHSLTEKGIPYSVSIVVTVYMCLYLLLLHAARTIQIFLKLGMEIDYTLN